MKCKHLVRTLNPSRSGEVVSSTVLNSICSMQSGSRDIPMMLPTFVLFVRKKVHGQEANKMCYEKRESQRSGKWLKAIPFPIYFLYVARTSLNVWSNQGWLEISPSFSVFFKTRNKKIKYFLIIFGWFNYLPKIKNKSTNKFEKATYSLIDIERMKELNDYLLFLKKSE